jgi:bla regulator protein blaR1
METLVALFDWILAASARAALLSLVVLAAQAVLRHRLPARWRYALWLPVLIVLLMPAFPESSWSVSSIIHVVPAPLPERTVNTHLALLPDPSRLAVAPHARTQMPWRQIMLLVWLGGFAGMMILGMAGFAQCLWRLKRSALPVSDPLQRELATLARGIGLRRLPRMWVASAIRSPAVTGVLRPALLLPANFEQTLAPHEKRLVLKHELMHIKRGDLPVNAVLCLLLALHWFNPLLWFAFFKARLDRETACDAQVLDGDNQAQRVAYGHTLLKVESAFGRHSLSAGHVGMFQRGVALRARIRSIASDPKPQPLMMTGLSLSIVLLTFLGITKAAVPDALAPQIYIATKFVEISERNQGSSSGAPLPAPLDAANKVPGLIGSLTDPEFQVLVRSLSQRKGVDLLSAPSVTTRPGQKAEVEICREFVYPDGAGKQVTEKPGIKLTVVPRITAANQIGLDFSSRIVEFEGFDNPKSDAEGPVFAKKVLHPDGTTTESVRDVKKAEVRESTFDARGSVLSERIVDPSEAGKKPVFTERNAKVDVVMTSGETMVLEMESRTDKQIVEELDEKDRVISSKTELNHRRVFVFVTARVIDRATGKPRVSKQAPPAK